MYRVFQPRGNALASLGTSVWIPSIGFMLGVERFLKADVLAMVGR